MFTVVKELRFNGVHNRYLVSRLQGVQYSIHATTTKLNICDKLNVISPAWFNFLKHWIFVIQAIVVDDVTRLHYILDFHN